MSSTGGLQWRSLFHTAFIPCLACFCLIFCPFANLFGADSGQISGRVFDSSGAVVPGAAVTATGAATAAKREAVSNGAGYYRIVSLPPGEYLVQVRKSGFNPIDHRAVRLEIGQVARLNYTLKPGDMRESLDVSAEPSLLDPETSSQGQIVEKTLIDHLPINGRNIVQLATLSPGVSGVGYSIQGTVMSGTRTTDSRPGSEIFANGNREQSNTYLLDGVDNSFRRNGLIVVRPSVEAVQEMQVLTNLFSAEYGRKPGAAINVVTKTGGNEWHGSLYEFTRNSALDARNYFAPAGDRKPVFQQNQFGGSIGGPLRRNSLFLFADYEGYRKRLVSTSVNTVPTAAIRGGDFSATRDVFDPFTTRTATGTPSGFIRDVFPNRTIPASRFDPVTAKLANAYPLPQRAGLANNQTSAPKEEQEWNEGDVRVDYNLTSASRLFGRYSRQDTYTLRPTIFDPVAISGLPYPVGLGDDNPAGDSDLVTHHAVLALTHSVSPTLYLDARLGFSRFAADFRQAGAVPGARLGEALGVRLSNQGPQSDGLPVFGISEFTGIGHSRTLPTIRIENNFNPTVGLTKIAGAHTLKFGYNGIRRQVTDFQTSQGNGRFNFNRNFTIDPNRASSTGDPMASFLLGTASRIDQDFLLAWVGLRLWEHGAFLQDDWRLTTRLTLNLGLRYEYDTPLSEVADRLANFDAVNGKVRIAGFNSDSAVGVQPDRNNLAPRFGFAYQLQPTTVLRGGYGIYYNSQGNGRVSFRLHRQQPFGGTNSENIDAFSNSPRRVQDGLRPIPSLDFDTVANRPSGEPLTLVDNFKSGYAQQFNLQIQQEIPSWRTVLKAGYVGNLSRQLQMDYNYNQPFPGPEPPNSRRPLGFVAPDVRDMRYGVSTGMGNYHAFQFSAERRYASGVGLLTAYTYSHSIDNVPTEQGAANDELSPQDARNISAERADSVFDLRHRLVQAVSYDLPVGAGKALNPSHPLARTLFGGWRTNMIAVFQTGLPFSPLLANSVSNAGESRPDRIGSGLLDNPDAARWFDSSFNSAGAAWATPRLYTFGNSGRNVLRGPGRMNFDVSLEKEHLFSERWRLQFRTEFFNLLNTPQFDQPDPTIGSARAGTITQIVGNPRQIQFALRLTF